jgi:ADP-heptose:LPS heptosyltransferase
MPRILIIKASSMGDVIHNLPMVTDVAEHILGAQIDWAGLAHLAAAIGCPTVAVYSDTDPMLTAVPSAKPAGAVNPGNKGARPSVPGVTAALTRMQVYPV